MREENIIVYQEARLDGRGERRKAKGQVHASETAAGACLLVQLFGLGYREREEAVRRAKLLEN